MAQLDVLIRKRSGMKAKLTNFSNYISSIGASGIVSELQHELQCRLNKYEALYDQFDELQVEIEVCSDKPEDEYEERSKFEERYYALMAQARNLLCRDGAADDGRSVAGSICKQAAMVKVIDDNGNSMDARLLLDNGSTANFITQSLCSKLKLSTRSVTNMKVEHLQRYQRINYIKQHFWKRFSKEYVSLLQTKTKWFHSTGQLSVGTLVLLKEAGQPPLLWPLGRVTKIYPGVDGGSRVAELKMKGKTVLRSYKNICPLPLD
ncbi:uncharacterized protein LOC106713092 isoform X1 [Papilio machaon]|uniref:uncharacterized protein LOC106713092 isoform X1 n=1 Tax=Papilio machaon TaxID=76193 RepID=UPI001E66308E|nr:uncharacterized protein LOC106713092 isoform X1 [Papilio machaon]